MSDTILGGDIAVYYSADNNQKRLKWTGTGVTGTTTGVRTVREVYSALQDLFDELAQMDDGVPMSAQTPTEYTIGAIDASDTIPWFIDDYTLQFLKGGAIQTKKWTRVTGMQAGILKIAVTANTSIVYADIGNTVTCTVGNTQSTGVLLDMQGSGATSVFFIRPTDATATHDFTGVTTFTCNAHTTGVMVATITTGEALWANIYSLGSLTVDKGNNPTSDLYVYRNGIKYYGFSSSGATATYQWWKSGHFDVLMKVKEPGAQTWTSAQAALSASTTTTSTVTLTAGDTSKLRMGDAVFGSIIPVGATISAITAIRVFTIVFPTTTTPSNAATSVFTNTIDGSYVTVFNREYDNTYDYFNVDLYNGGRNPIPLATGDDLNNHTATRMFVGNAGTGTGFVTNEVIYTGASLLAATAKGVVTKVSGTAPNQTVYYYLIGDITELTATVTGAVSGQTATGFSTSPTASDEATNPATLATSPTVTLAGTTVNIGNGAGAKQYAIVVDPVSNTNRLSTVYEWLKYKTRRGETTWNPTNDTSIKGERYIGPDTLLYYADGPTGTYASGTLIFQAATGASGYVVAQDITSATNYILVRNTRGTFNASAVIDTAGVTVTPTSATTITPIKPNPFGTFAGGKYFAAPGVAVNIANLNSLDVQAYQLTALTDFSVQVPPNLVSVAITGLLPSDGAGIFRTSVGAINKSVYTSGAGNTLSGTSLVMNATIDASEPAAGYIRMVSINAGTGMNEEHRYRYSSWTTTTFTLASITNLSLLTPTVTQVSGNLFQIVNTTNAIDANAQVGDMIYNFTNTSHRYASIVSISADRLTITFRVYGATPVVGDWVTGNVVYINKIVKAYVNSTDKAYVPIIDKNCTTSDTYDAVSGTYSIANSLIHSSDIPVLVRVRQYKLIQPFEQATSVKSTGLTVSAIRTADSIAQ